MRDKPKSIILGLFIDKTLEVSLVHAIPGASLTVRGSRRNADGPFPVSIGSPFVETSCV
jgi:hypothetical protein